MLRSKSSDRRASAPDTPAIIFVLASNERSDKILGQGFNEFSLMSQYEPKWTATFLENSHSNLQTIKNISKSFYDSSSLCGTLASSANVILPLNR